MIFIYLFFALLSLSQARLEYILAANDNITTTKLIARANYLANTQQVINCYTCIHCLNQNISTYVAQIIQLIPDFSKLTSLNVVLYAKLSNGTYVNPPDFQMATNETHLFLGTTYTADKFTEAYGCTTLPESGTYLGRICHLTLQYIGIESDLALAIMDFNIGIKVPKQISGTVSITGVKIYKNLCNCEVLKNYTLIVSAYSDPGCTIPMVGDSVEYGSNVCLKLSSTDPYINSYFFEPTSLLMAYGNELLEIIPMATINSGKATATVNFDLLTTGQQVSFIVTLALKRSQRLLEDLSTKNGLGLQGKTMSYNVVPAKVASNLSTRFTISIELLLVILILSLI